jgi:hypothetical protein
MGIPNCEGKNALRSNGDIIHQPLGDLFCSTRTVAHSIFRCNISQHKHKKREGEMRRKVGILSIYHIFAEAHGILKSLSAVGRHSCPWYMGILIRHHSI